jgi:hypothetical protein
LYKQTLLLKPPSDGTTFKKTFFITFDNPSIKLFSYELNKLLICSCLLINTYLLYKSNLLSNYSNLSCKNWPKIFSFKLSYNILITIQLLKENCNTKPELCRIFYIIFLIKTLVSKPVFNRTKRTRLIKTNWYLVCNLYIAQILLEYSVTNILFKLIKRKNSTRHSYIYTKEILMLISRKLN